MVLGINKHEFALKREQTRVRISMIFNFSTGILSRLLSLKRHGTRKLIFRFSLWLKVNRPANRVGKKKMRVLMPFQRTFRKSLRRFEERVADPSENLWDDLSKVWRNRFQNTGLIMIWGVCFWVLNINKLQLIFSRIQQLILKRYFHKRNGRRNYGE